MLWNPIQPTYAVRPVCMHENCAGSLVLKCWKMGQTHSLQPRILHDCKCTVLLVAALYSCPFGHEVSSTDPRLMSQLPQEQIPFVLLHKTGFLKHFAASVLELVAQGMTFTHVERFVQNRRQQFVTSLLLQVQQLHHQGISTDGLQQSTAVKLLSEPAPSNDILNQCFLADFFENRDAYNLHMSLLPIKEFISLDHTFKVTSNIGFLRSDGKWVTLYRCNQHDYEGFLPDINIQQEAMKFMQSGYFFGELADTIILALSNLLGLPFIVFTSSIYQPVITITPRHLKVPIPVYLAFNQSGAGHYDGVVVCDDERIQPLALPVTSNGADAGKDVHDERMIKQTHHTVILLHQSSITCCTCCKESKPCTNLCKCKTCNNPFGKKLPTTESMQTSRK